jgi:hypothetical protein
LIIRPRLIRCTDSHRDGDAVRHEHVRSLGAIATPPTVADRAAFGVPCIEVKAWKSCLRSPPALQGGRRLRSRHDNARGLSGQVLQFATRSSTEPASSPRRFEAVPVHVDSW